MEGNVILSKAHLLWDLNNMNLDIDLEEMFAKRVNFDKTGVDCAVKSTEFGDQTNIALRYGFVGIWAADATRNGAHGSYTCAQCIDHASIPTITACITLTGEGLSISRLEIFYLRRLDVDHWAVASWTISIIRRSYPKQGFGISMVLSSISFHVGGHNQRE
jgi:hypothetical protein